jgi:hypothetical protein
LTRRIIVARQALGVTGWLLAAAVLAQVFLAGRAVFASPEWWQRHRAFVHSFEWLAPVAVVLSYLARATRPVKILAWLTVALLFFAYATAGLQSSLGKHGFAALHPIVAVLLFWTSVELARRARDDQRRSSSPTVTTRPAAG